MMPDLTQTQLKALVSYDEQTGLFRWKRGRPGCSEGAIAGGRRRAPWGDYMQIRVNRKIYSSHRLAWFYVHGEWPKGQIDHINGDGTDNRIKNLRECSNQENAQNRSRRSRGVSGHTAITWNKQRKKWRVKIQKNRKSHDGGFYSSLQDALIARDKLKSKLHEFCPEYR